MITRKSLVARSNFNYYRYLLYGGAAYASLTERTYRYSTKGFPSFANGCSQPKNPPGVRVSGRHQPCSPPNSRIYGDIVKLKTSSSRKR